MTGYIKNSISLKITIPLIGILAVLMTVFSLILIDQRTKSIDALIFAKTRSLMLTGALTVEQILDHSINAGLISETDLFDTNYRLITEGPLSGSNAPKYHTRYDSYLDNTILGTLDAFVEEDPSIIFAVIVDVNGYVPTHNSRYSKPLTGDPSKDRDNNRTKRIFNDPVGLAAAMFESTPEQPVLRQIYRRDTGETMWDLAAPIYVRGKHWGAFRIGLSLADAEQSIDSLRLTFGLSMLALLLTASLTIIVVVKRRLRPLERVTAGAKNIATGQWDERIQVDSADEIGTLVNAFNLMTEKLQQTTVSRDYFDRIVESMHDSLLIISRTGVILRANQAACSLLGYHKNELVDRPVVSILSGDADKDDASPEAFNIERFCPPFSITSGDGRRFPLLIAKNGRKIPVSLSSSPMLNDAGEIQALIWVAQDISRRRKMELSLKMALEKARQLAINLENRNETIAASNAQLSKAHAELKSSQSIILQQEKLATIGQLAAGLAHEVSKPIGFISRNLNALSKYLEKLTAFLEVQDRANSILPDGPLKEDINTLRKKLKLDFLLQDSQDLIKESLGGTERVSKIVQDLKNFSNSAPEDLKMVNLNECLDNSIDIVWNELKYKATLHRDYSELPLTRCYPRKLNLVFMNLLLNASRAIEKQGEITVKTRCENEYVRIWISDTGSGIPQPNLQKIFDPFFTTNEGSKGTGLGLSVAHEIVTQHNGTISVSSEVGKGTTFAINLPLVED